jgi:hypothetical protein
MARYITIEQFTWASPGYSTASFPEAATPTQTALRLDRSAAGTVREARAASFDPHRNREDRDHSRLAVDRRDRATVPGG